MALAASGQSLRAISRTLASERMLVRNGGPVTPMTLSRFVNNRAVGDRAVAP